LRADLAVVAAGGTLVALDPALDPGEVRGALLASGAIQAIASDETQLARLLALRPELPALEMLLLSAAAPSERKPPALLIDSAMEVGESALAAEPDLLRHAISTASRGAVCVSVTPSGTSTATREELHALASHLAGALGLRKDASLLCALPVGSLPRLAAGLASLGAGSRLLLPRHGARPDDGLDTEPADAVLLDVPGLERLHRAWTEDIDGLPWLRRTLTRWAIARGAEEGGPAWKRGIAESLAFRRIRRKLGGRAARIDVIAGFPGGASPGVDAFFRSVGLAVRYHSTDVQSSMAR
jgi:long-subunit acyl-CoA synthetase (AMP-forming)